MHKFFCLLLLVLPMVACEQNNYEELCNGLSGTWQAKHPNGEVYFQERWKTDNYQFLGVGEQFTKGESNFKESLELLEENGNIYYVVTGVNPQPTRFLVVNSSSNYFLAENLKNDFPKYIKYKIYQDSIHAMVFAEKDTLRFHLHRKK